MPDSTGVCGVGITGSSARISPSLANILPKLAAHERLQPLCLAITAEHDFGVEAEYIGDD
jgi:hypothetical protein